MGKWRKVAPRTDSTTYYKMEQDDTTETNSYVKEMYRKATRPRLSVPHLSAQANTENTRERTGQSDDDI